MRGGDCMSGYALQASQREHEQGGARGVLPGSWNQASCVSTQYFLKRQSPYMTTPSILHRHIKRQIISLAGGFQVIADLNTYHAFISSLKVLTLIYLTGWIWLTVPIACRSHQ